MNTPTYDGVFLAPESIVSEPSAAAFLNSGRNGPGNGQSDWRAGNHLAAFGRLQRTFRFLARKISTLLQ